MRGHDDGSRPIGRRAKTTVSRWSIAALGAVVVLGASPAGAQDPARVTRSVNATVDDVAPTRTYAAPYVLVDPADPLTVVAGTVDMRARTCHLLRSRDGGQTWRLLDASPSPQDYPFCFHTSGMTTMTPMGMGRDGAIYMGMVGWGPQDEDAGRDAAHAGSRGNLSVIVSRSDDLGDSWQPVVAHNTRGLEGEDVQNNRPVSSLAVDRTTGDQDRVYVGYVQRQPNADPEVPNEPMVVASTDGGETFSPPVSAFGDFERVLSAEEFDLEQDHTIGVSFSAAPQLAVADDGTLYVLFGGSAPRGSDLDDVLLLARSTDNGQTFTVNEIGTMGPSFAYPTFAWSPVGGEQGTLHMVYEDKPDGPLGDRDVYHRRSTDGGATFSAPQQLNDDAAEQLAGQYQASVSVAPNGRVDVAWWDFRNDPGLFANDVYATWSNDNGESWAPNVRVSDQSIDRDIGTWSNGFDMRQPPGIGSADDYAVFAWDDTRLADAAGQSQDVFAAAVQFSPVAVANNTLRYVIAGLIGLALGGAALLVVGSRMRTGPQPQQRERVPAGV
ncbi:MAG: glycoside hydrolase [Actinomycetota bacterium]|nr:glycoside hydrolase [Actinomycetota bacterium]